VTRQQKQKRQQWGEFQVSSFQFGTTSHARDHLNSGAPGGNTPEHFQKTLNQLVASGAD
jgi:hypothetical protein